MAASPNLISRLNQRLRFRFYEMQNARHLARLARAVARHASPDQGQKPVVFFNASTRLRSLSLNAAFSALAAWGLRLSGVPVVHFVCQAGMSRCLLGTNPDDHTAEPPCKTCIAQSRQIYAGADAHWFSFIEDKPLADALAGLSVPQLGDFVYQGIPLGEITVPSLRWVLRRHHLVDDEATRYLLRQYILSAYNIHKQFEAFLDRVDPSAVVVFNGTMYPEQVARRLAKARGIKVFAHEVSFQPLAGFFTSGRATAYPIDIPEDFELNDQQNQVLDEYLAKRFQGNFTMAGIQFWPEMHGLDEGLQQKISHFKQLVPVFTNVIFDTSQPHANTVFEHMFAWLDLVLEIIKAHPETLFVIRAHPDELRPGTRKQARESVRGWVQRHQVTGLPNVVFIDSQEYISSYDLIHRAKYILVYNSSIALEATLLGKAVLCGGRARFTPYPAVFFPQSVESYRQKAEEFLAAETIEIPAEFPRNARRFLYYQNWRTPLPFGDFLQPHSLKGYVRFNSFPVEQLKPENSPSLKVVSDGIMGGAPFLMPDELEAE